MLLTLRPLTQLTSPNHYYINDPVFQLRSGDAPLLIFRLIDNAVDTQQQGYNPGGRPYFPIYGLTDRLITSTFMGNSNTGYAVAFGNTLTISVTNGLTWSTVAQPGDKLIIPTGSVFAGAANANVGNYTVLAGTATTISAVTINNTTPPVNVGTPVGPVTFNPIPSLDIQDFSYSAVLNCVVFNVNTALSINRFANQLFPQVDPTIWGLQLFPGDAPSLAGMNDIYLTLYENSSNGQQKITQGYAKSVLSVQPTATAFSTVPINNGTGTLTTF